MAKIEEQKQYISKLANLIHLSVAAGYEQAVGVFEYEVFDDGSASTGITIFYISGGEKNGVFPSDDLDFDPYECIKLLHRSVFEHTGGNWAECKITLDSEGEAKVNFTY